MDFHADTFHHSCNGGPVASHPDNPTDAASQFLVKDCLVEVSMRKLEMPGQYRLGQAQSHSQYVFRQGICKSSHIARHCYVFRDCRKWHVVRSGKNQLNESGTFQLNDFLQLDLGFNNTSGQDYIRRLKSRCPLVCF